MKRFLSAFIVIIGLAITLTPVINGIVMEKIIRKNLQDANDLYAETGSDITLQIIRYDRHFLSSDILWKIDMGNLQGVYGIDEVLLNDHAKHGITGIVSTTSLDQNEWFRTFLNDKLKGENPLSIITKYNLSGTIESTITVNAFSTTVDGEVVNIKPATVTTSLCSGFEKMTSSATWGGGTVGQVVSMDEFKLESEFTKISNYIWEGDISYHVKKVSGKNLEDRFEMNDFNGKYFLDYQKNTNSLSTGMMLDIASIKNLELSVEDASITVTINKLDATGYEAFMKIYSDIVNTAIDHLPAVENDSKGAQKQFEQQMASAGLQMLPVYEKLLKAGLEFKISDLKATLPSGEITGNLLLKLNQDMTFAQALPIMQQPVLAFELIEIESELRFPKELAEDKQEMLTTPLHPGMKTGFFVVDGTYLEHKAKTKNGALILNGQEFSF